MSKRSSLYRDPRWQRKRLEIMKRDEFKCVACGKSDGTLNVHHGRYDEIDGAFAPWATDDAFLQTLCECCHSALGQHNKAGIMYARDGYGLYITVACCPVCGFDKWRDKGSYVKCQNCGNHISFANCGVASELTVCGVIE